MYEILSLFSDLSTTQIRQFSRIVIGLLSMTGRVSMKTPEGGSFGRSNFNTIFGSFFIP